MANYNRIKGDYTLKTIVPGSNVVLDTSTVSATGNIVATNFLGNIYANAFFYANGTPFTGGGGGNAALPLANGTSNFNIATASGNATITTDGTNTWTFETTGEMTIPGNIRATDSANTSLYAVSDIFGNGTVELKVINVSGNVLGSNIRVTRSNATISTNNEGFTWLFDNTGILTLPGLTAQIISGTDEVGIFSDVNDYNGMTANTTVTNILNQGNVAIVTSSGNANIAWTFDDTGNLTLPGNTFAVNYANGTPVNISGGGSGYGDANVVTLLSSFGSNAISTTGNVTANFFIGDGSQLTNLPAGNYSNANVVTLLSSFGSNAISTTGNVTANYIIGDGSQLTAVNAATVDITDTNGLTTTYYPTFVENRTTGQIARADVDLTYRTDDNLLSVGNLSVTGNVTAGFFSGNGAGLTGVIATGNVGSASQLANGTSSLNVPVADGNIIGNISGTTNVLILSNTGLQINGDISASGNITGLNINSSNADLAECYRADADYAPGTVVMFGGTAEVTLCNTDACPAVAGVISAAPAYKMNSELDSPYVATVALVGRVPVQVQGPVSAGAMMVSAGNGRARAESAPAMGTVIGKAVQAHTGGHGIIEIVVGRL